MKYYLIPVECLHFEDENNEFQVYLKNMYPKIYRAYKEHDYMVDEYVSKLLQEENIPAYFLFTGKKQFLNKTVKLTEPITEVTISVPGFYAMSHEISKQQALFFLRNLSEDQICTIALSYYNFINDKSTRHSKVIKFPLQRVSGNKK